MKKLILILVSLLLVTGCRGIFGDKTDVKPDIPKEGSNPGWSVYENKALGIKFEYKDEWGEPQSGPSQNITRLSDVNEGYGDHPGNLYADAVIVGFANFNSPRIEFLFYSDDHVGQNCTSRSGTAKPCEDTYESLVESGDICDYQFGTGHEDDEPYYRDKQTFVDCNEDLSSIIYYISHIPGYFNYDFSMYGYKKLGNGYFDNLLIKYSFINVQLNDDTIDTPEKLIPAAVERGKQFGWELDSEDYEGAKNDFAHMLSTIEIYPTNGIYDPVVKKQKSKNDDYQLIYDYYYNIATGNLKDAYPMNVDPSVTVTEFNDWYKDVYNAEVYDIEELTLGEYRFRVRLYEHNKTPEIYRVVKRVDDGKLNSVSSFIVSSEVVYDDNLSAFVLRSDNSINLHLLKNGEEQIIAKSEGLSLDQFETGFYKGYHVSKFSPDGKYLIYYVRGWEYSGGSLYDVERGINYSDEDEDKEFSLTNPEFTPDSMYLYDCSGNGMTSNAGFDLLSLQNGVELVDSIGYEDLPNSVFGLNCTFDQSSYTLKVDYLDDVMKVTGQKTYDLKQRKFVTD